MRRTGVAGTGLLWTEEDDAVLRECWPDTAASSARLPKRTKAAIRFRAKKLGLPGAKTIHIWSAAEITRFNRLWSTATREELLAAFPWATWTALANQAQYQRRLGRSTVKRPKIPFKRSGHRALDAILTEAERSDLTLGDIDLLAGSGRYFRKGRFRRSVGWKYVGRAIDELGGEVDVEWPE